MAVGVSSEELLESLQEKTLNSCHDILTKKLDVNEVYSWMNKKNLLTREDRHTLQDTGKSREAKVNHIIEILPRKGKGWWGNFITSLRESTSGTAHEFLASKLSSLLNRQIYEFSQQTLEQTVDPHSLYDMYHRARVHHDSTHVPSGISQDMHDFMPDMLPATDSYTKHRPGSIKVKSPDITKLLPDLADIITPIIKLKKNLDDVNYSYKVIKNQVRLLQAFDELLENTIHFHGALSALLKLYIDKFKTRKRYNYLELTIVEQKVIKIIEDITECTEDIDIHEESQVWEQCIKKIEKNRDFVKEALYSLETNKMVAIQETLKLDSAEAETAKEWIVVREHVVKFGNESLTKLDELRSQNNTLITSVYDAVKKRVRVGEECLKAWTNWVDQRIKLAS